MRLDDDMSKSLETCEVLVYFFMVSGTDYINNIKMKELRVLLCY